MEDPAKKTVTLSVSIVHYRSDEEKLAQTITSCKNAIYHAQHQGLLTNTPLFFVENSKDPYARLLLEQNRASWPGRIIVITPKKNLGFGAGHNLAIERLPNPTATEHFHLILNPDVILERDAISQAIRFMLQHPQTACISPHCVDKKGQKVYLCKRYPSILVLLGRGFLHWTKVRWLRRMLADYEMRGVTEDEVVESVPIASGCFMFWRAIALKELNGFDPLFFLYFEDFDLCMRLNKRWRISYVPNVRITHFGGNASKKGLRHIYLFCKSGLQFFQKHGWKWV